MKRRWFTISLPISLLALCILIPACKKDDVAVNNPPQEFVMRIDSLAIQKPVISGDTLKGRVWGTLGSNTCYSFSRFQKLSADSFSVRIKVFAIHSPSSFCGPGIQKLNGAVYRVYPVYRGRFQFVIEQPDGTTLRDSADVI